MPRNEDDVLRRGLLLPPHEESVQTRNRIPSSRARTVISPSLPWVNRTVIKTNFICKMYAHSPTKLQLDGKKNKQKLLSEF